MVDEDDATPLTVPDLVKKTATAIPAAEMYRDLLQPAARELGKGLETTAKAVTGLLMPLRAVVWGMEQIERDFVPRVAAKLANVPEGALQTPKMSVAGPTIEALKFLGEEPVLREIFANLLATSMKKETASISHPSFVQMAKEITADEARIIYFFGKNASTKDSYPTIDVHSKSSADVSYKVVVSDFSLIGIIARCEFPRETQGYLINLRRLGLIEIVDDAYLADSEAYTPLREHPWIKKAFALIESEGRRADIKKKLVRMTHLGRQFYNACVADSTA